MNRNRFLDLYATYLWPVMRRVVKKPRRCKKCILSEKYAPLKDGLCPECSAAQTVAAPDLEVSDETRAKFDENLLPQGSDSPMVSNSSLIVSMAAVDILNLGYSSFCEQRKAKEELGYESRSLDAMISDCYRWLLKEGRIAMGQPTR